MTIDGKILHKRSNETNGDGTPKAPSLNDLEYGEIAFNFSKDVETMFIRNANDEIIANLINGTDERALQVMTEHIGRKDNPHNTTKEQIGLGNVDNTADIDKPISNATQLALDNKIEKTDITNNLSTNSSEKVLSAAQGIELKKLIDNVAGEIVATDITNLVARVVSLEEEVHNTEIMEDEIIALEDEILSDFSE